MEIIKIVIGLLVIPILCIGIWIGWNAGKKSGKENSRIKVSFLGFGFEVESREDS